MEDCNSTAIDNVIILLQNVILWRSLIVLLFTPEILVKGFDTGVLINP